MLPKAGIPLRARKSGTLLLVCLVLVVFACVIFLQIPWPAAVVLQTCFKEGVRNTTRPLVRGPPSPRFRDNLINDTQYLTSWTNAGWTNDVMTLGNMLYLAQLTGRVPIIPPFIPTEHVAWEATPLAFGDVFDLPRLREATGREFLEWHEVKLAEGGELEELGCWSVWKTAHQEDKPRHSFHPWRLKLDISYTGVPQYAVLGRNDHAFFWPLATLGFPDARSRSLGNPLPSPEHHALLDPDDHLLCFDFLYYVAAGPEIFEYERDYSPAWHTVVSKLRFTQTLERVAESHLRRTLGIDAHATIPPYIAVHVRHGDFLRECSGPKEACMTPLSTWDTAVRDVKQSLLERRGLHVEHIIVTSDERNQKWWDEAAALGWLKMEREIVPEARHYGKWHDILVDAVTQSGAIGLVGTAASTMSLLAGRRTEDWHGGIYKLVPATISGT